MSVLMRRQFRYGGRSLEVRAELLAHAWHVGIYEGGTPVIGGIARCSRRDVERARRRDGEDLLERTMLSVQDKVEKGQLRLR